MKNKDINKFKLHKNRDRNQRFKTSKLIKSTNSQLRKFENWISLVVKIFDNLYPDVEWKSLMKIYLNQVTNLIHNNQLSYCLAYFKKVRSILYKFISGCNLPVEHGIKLTKDNIPVFLQEGIPFIRSLSKPHLLAILSLSNIGRLFKGIGKIKTDTIERKSTLDTNLIISDDTIQNYCKYHAFGNVNHRGIEFNIRSSNGPFGPAMTSIVEEAKLLPPELIDYFKILASDEDNVATEALEIINDIRMNNIDVPNALKAKYNKKYLKTLRIITCVEDKEGKDRVIAILDYGSQLFLKPYHQTLMGLIENNFWSNDATMDQTRSVNDLKKEILIYKNSNPDQAIHSLDLKAATDLMPMHLQKRLFGAIFGEQKAEAWSKILTSIPGTVKDESFRQIQYGTGQPMGAYSSGPMLALTHHLIVYKSKEDAAIKKLKDSGEEINTSSIFKVINSDTSMVYKLLGDDIVIAGDVLATNYKRIISNLGMEIQLTKTIESNDSYEFVKRFFKSGEEYSPLPLGELSYSTEQYWTVSSFIHKMTEVGYKFHNSQLIDIIVKHFGIGRKRIYMKHKIESYVNSINPFRDDGDDDIDYKLSKGIKPSFGNLGCNATTDLKRQGILQMFMKVQMDFIHETLTQTVRNCQKGFNDEGYQNYKQENNKYHPLVNVVHFCVRHLNEIEYQNSSNALEETNRFYKLKLSLKDFILFPKDIETVYSKSGHQSKLKGRAILNNRLQAYINELMVSEFSEIFRG